jgi:hypothetical protein
MLPNNRLTLGSNKTGVWTVPYENSGESVSEWSRSRTHNSDVVGSRPGAAVIF